MEGRRSFVTWLRFWYKVCKEYRFCGIVDVNEWDGDSVREDIAYVFIILCENDKERSVVDLCPERGICVGSTSFKHKYIHLG